MAWAATNPIPIYAIERVAQLIADDLGVDVEVTKLGGTRWHLVDSCGADLAHIEPYSSDRRGPLHRRRRHTSDTSAHVMYRIVGKVSVFIFIFIVGWLTGVVSSADAIRAGKIRGVKIEKSPGSSLLAHWNSVTEGSPHGYTRRRSDEHTH
jgi:hypothetical protein